MYFHGILILNQNVILRIIVFLVHMLLMVLVEIQNLFMTTEKEILK